MLPSCTWICRRQAIVLLAAHLEQDVMQCLQRCQLLFAEIARPRNRRRFGWQAFVAELLSQR